MIQAYSRHKSLILIIITGAVISIISIYSTPFQPIMSEYFKDIKDILKDGSMVTNFNPVGYPLLLVPGYALLGDIGIRMEQALCYIVFLLIIYKILFSYSNISRFAWITFLIIAIHPYVILNINRINDNAVTIVLMAILIKLIIIDNGLFPSKRGAFYYGIALGFYIAIRPNAIVFILIPLAAILINHKLLIRVYIQHLFIFLLAVTISLLIINFLGTKNPFYWPKNGPYNFFAGNNPYTIESLEKFGNGEQSIGKALSFYADTTENTHMDLHQIDPKIYLDHTINYIENNPFETIKLWTIKFYVFFAPDLRQANTLLKKIIQIVLAFPFVLWIMLLAMFIIQGRNVNSLILPLIFVSLFVLPFIVTNSDARFRMPVLDIFLIIHSLFLIDEILKLKVNSYNELNKQRSL